jgi:hypothetical protein
MGTASSAQLKALLVGVDLPAEKPALLAYAVRQRAEPPLIDALQSLPERNYASLDEVVEELLRVQPRHPNDGRPGPHEESGEPPGRAAYTDSHPDTGKVPDLDTVKD